MLKATKRLKLHHEVTTNTTIVNNTPVNMAQIILQNALNVGLYVELDEITPGDGNCFYHAIIQKVNRHEICAQLGIHFILPITRHSEEQFVHMCNQIMNQA